MVLTRKIFMSSFCHKSDYWSFNNNNVICFYVLLFPYLEYEVLSSLETLSQRGNGDKVAVLVGNCLDVGSDLKNQYYID